MTRIKRPDAHELRLWASVLMSRGVALMLQQPIAEEIGCGARAPPRRRHEIDRLAGPVGHIQRSHQPPRLRMPPDQVLPSPIFCPKMANGKAQPVHNPML